MKIRENIGSQTYKWLCILVILLVVGIRLHLAGIPFERDEGEYAYAGQMITHGVPPYQEVYNMKFPGVYFMYALAIKLFGETVSAPRYLILILQLIGAGFLFVLARRVINPLAGWLSAAAFMLFNLTLILQGIMGNAEHFVVAFLIPSLYFLYKGMEEESIADLFISGILVSIACLMKQHAIAFTVVGIIWILYVQGIKSFKYLIAYGVGGMIPILLMALYLWHAGVWDHFYFLTIQYAREYAGAVPVSYAIEQLNPVNYDIKRWSVLLVWFVIISVLGILLPGGRSKARPFLLVMLVGSGIAVSPGFLFRWHYFLLMIPVFALLFTNTVLILTGYLNGRMKYVVMTFFIAANVLFFMVYQHQVFFVLPSESVTENLYPGTPFSISGEVASYIKQHTMAGDRICMLGAEPQLFYLSQRRSASGYIYIYPLLEPQKYARRMTDEFIEQSEAHKPAILVFSSKSVFEDGNNKDSRLFKWFDVYKKQYRLTATYARNSENDQRMVPFDTIAPMDTLSDLVPQIRVYERIK